MILLYTSNEHVDMEIKDSMLPILPKKYYLQSLKKYEKDPYIENYKKSKKSPEEDERIKIPSKWRDIPYSWIGRCNILKIPILAKWTYRFNAIPAKISSRILVDTGKIILKFMKKDKGTIAGTISKKNKVRKNQST